MGIGMYFLMISMGMLGVLCAGKLLSHEMWNRRESYREQLHTRFAVYQGTMSLDLTRTHYVIGRRKRRCDINLEQLKDRSIAKVHAVLWYDGHSFCIAPIYRKTGKEKKKAYTSITINGVPVPPCGSVVRYGDMIRMGNHRFVLLDSRKG